MELVSFKIEKEKSIIQSMTDYLELSIEEHDYFDDYTKTDIKKCSLYLDNYINSLIELQNNAKVNDSNIEDCIKEIVVQLNELNDNSDGVLIERRQRKDLCNFILKAAKITGYQNKKDITKKWRSW